MPCIGHAPLRAGLDPKMHAAGIVWVDFYAPTTIESMMEHLSRDMDVIRPTIVKHPLTQEVKE